MTIELLIQAIVRHTTILIAQLATAQGVRAPLAQIADQVFMDLVRELEREGVSRKVSADMFGLGLRTFRRKIQRLSESSTERGRSLREVVLEFVRERGLLSRQQILLRFPQDDELQIRAVLRDLCDSQLLFSSGSGENRSYRAATNEELTTLQRSRGPDGADELLIALIYREEPLTVEQIAAQAQSDLAAIQPTIERLLSNGRLQRIEGDGQPRYRVGGLVIPFGAASGWEAAVLDHFKALVTTILCKLRDPKLSGLDDAVGGSTYTIDVWDGHPLAEEVYGSLARIRRSLSDLRSRADQFNASGEIPARHTRVVIYAGQALIHEDDGRSD
jgi:hypothetical protein